MDPNDEDFNYDRQYKKMCTGLGSFLNAAQQNNSLQAQDWTNESSSSSTTYTSNELSRLCDTGVSIPNKPQTNQSKNSLYECLVCNVPCNSEFMYEQHVQGAKHRKKVRNMAKLEDLKAGGDGTGKASSKAASILESFRHAPNGMESRGISQEKNCLLNTQPVPPLSLRDMLRETTSPVVALHYVVEILPETKLGPKGEMFETAYTCDLCCVTTQAIPMLAHLTGNKHRHTYLEMRFKEVHKDKFSVLKRAQEIQDKEGKRIDLIKTVISDAKYPFPPGQEPAKRENGPNGMTSYLVDGYDTCQNNDYQAKEDLFSRKSDESNFIRAEDIDPSKKRLSHIAILLEKLSTCAVKNDDDALLAHEVSKKLIQSLVDYKIKTVHSQHSKSLENSCESVLKAIHTLYYLPPLKCPTQSIQDSLNYISKHLEFIQPDQVDEPNYKTDKCEVVFRKRKLEKEKKESVSQNGAMEYNVPSIRHNPENDLENKDLDGVPEAATNNDKNDKKENNKMWP